GRYADRQRAVVGERQFRLRKPARSSFNPQLLSREQVRHETFRAVWIGKREFGRRMQQIDSEAQFAGRGYCRRDLKRRCNLPRHVVDTREPTQQWHDRTSILSHGENWRFDTLVLK